MKTNNNEDITVDVGLFWKVIKRYRYICLLIIIICTLIAAIVAFMLPKMYSSTTLVRIKTANNIPVVLTDIAAQVGADVTDSPQNSPESYIEIMKSREVLEPVIQKLDISDEAKAKTTAAGFAKSNLEFSNVKKTNLITIVAYGKTPEEAQMIAQGVVDSFKQLMIKLNKSDNEGSVSFLQQRVIESKKEMEEAEDKLAAYQKEKKIYAPSDQVKAIIANLSSYDKAMAELQAETESNSAKLAEVTEQLQQQNESLLAYNVSDNANIGNLREAIVNKRVELVGLEQRYTDQHPDVIRAKEELASLNDSLTDEISSAVNSQSVTLSPVQSSLLKDKLETETKITVAEISLKTLENKENETEELISTLSTDTVEYTRLFRDSKIKSDIYTTLVKSYEQTRLDEANKTMNLQVVDPASLPLEDMPAKPNKRLIVIIGFVVGIMISAACVVFIYIRKYGK